MNENQLLDLTRCEGCDNIYDKRYLEKEGCEICRLRKRITRLEEKLVDQNRLDQMRLKAEEELAEANSKIAEFIYDENNPPPPITKRMREILLGQKLAIAHCDEDVTDEYGLCKCMHRLADTILAETETERHRLDSVMKAVNAQIVKEALAKYFKPCHPWMERLYGKCPPCEECELAGVGDTCNWLKEVNDGS